MSARMSFDSGFWGYRVPFGIIALFMDFACASRIAEMLPRQFRGAGWSLKAHQTQDRRLNTPSPGASELRS